MHPTFKKGFSGKKNVVSKYISLSVKITSFLAKPLFFCKENDFFQDFQIVKNNASVLRRTQIFSSENHKRKSLVIHLK